MSIFHLIPSDPVVHLPLSFPVMRIINIIMSLEALLYVFAERSSHGQVIGHENLAVISGVNDPVIGNKIATAVAVELCPVGGHVLSDEEERIFHRFGYAVFFKIKQSR